MNGDEDILDAPREKKGTSGGRKGIDDALNNCLLHLFPFLRSILPILLEVLPACGCMCFFSSPSFKAKKRKPVTREEAFFSPPPPPFPRVCYLSLLLLRTILISTPSA